MYLTPSDGGAVDFLLTEVSDNLCPRHGVDTVGEEVQSPFLCTGNPLGDTIDPTEEVSPPTRSTGKRPRETPIRYLTYLICSNGEAKRRGGGWGVSTTDSPRPLSARTPGRHDYEVLSQGTKG